MGENIEQRNKNLERQEFMLEFICLFSHIVFTLQCVFRDASLYPRSYEVLHVRKKIFITKSRNIIQLLRSNPIIRFDESFHLYLSFQIFCILLHYNFVKLNMQ